MSVASVGPIMADRNGQSVVHSTHHFHESLHTPYRVPEGSEDTQVKGRTVSDDRAVDRATFRTGTGDRG